MVRGRCLCGDVAFEVSADIGMGGVEGEPGSRPRAHIFVGSKAPWYAIADTLPQHTEYAPS